MNKKNLRFEEITPENINLATKIELEFFPDMCAYCSYEDSFKNNNRYWIVYDENEIVGITGIYENAGLGEPNTCWMGWFGVLPEKRQCGYGKAILKKTIEIAKEMKYDTFRLYTSKILCPEAIFFYDKLMDFGEDYTLEELELQRRVYTKSLTDKPATKWKNKKLNLDYEKKREEKGMKKYLSSLKK